MQPSKCQGAQLGRSAAVPDCPDPSPSVPHAKPTAPCRRRPRAADAAASADPGSVAMPHGREQRYRARTETRSSEPGTHGLFLRETSEPGLLRTSSIRVAAIVTNAAYSVLCLLCRFPDPECSRLLCGSPSGSRWWTRRCRSMSERMRWWALEGDWRFRMASYANRAGLPPGHALALPWASIASSVPPGPWQISRHRWPGQVTEARPGHVPPDARRRTANSPHPCRTYGGARPAERLDSTALSRRSLIRMRPLVQVQPGPQIGP